MRVQAAIESLSKKNPDEQIIIAWWDSEAFANLNLSHKEWNDIIYTVESWMDWSSAHEALELHLMTAKEDHEKEE